VASSSLRTVYYHVLTCVRAVPKYIMKLKIYPEYVGLCGSCRHASLAKTTNGGFLARCDWFDWSVRVSNRQWRKSKEYINNPYWGDEDD